MVILLFLIPIECCRLLYRLKTVNQLSEMVELPDYNNWIEHVFQFTKNSFASKQVCLFILILQWSLQSLSYLLNFWSKICVSVSTSGYARPKAFDQIEDYSAIVIF